MKIATSRQPPFGRICMFGSPFPSIEQSQIQVFAKAWVFMIQRLVLRSFIGMSCWKWWIHDRSVGWFHLFTGLKGPTYRDEILQILPYHSLLSTSSVHGTLDANPCSYNQLQLGWWILVYLWWNIHYMIYRSVCQTLRTCWKRRWTTKSACKNASEESLLKWPNLEGFWSSSSPFLFGRPTSLLMAPLPPQPSAPVPRRSAAPARLGASKRCKRRRKRCPWLVSTGFLEDQKPGSPTTHFFGWFTSFTIFEGRVYNHHPIQEPPFLTMVATTSREKFTYPHGSLSVATVLFSVRRGVALGRHRDGFPIKACSFLWFVF